MAAAGRDDTPGYYGVYLRLPRGDRYHTDRGTHEHAVVMARRIYEAATEWWTDPDDVEDVVVKVGGYLGPEVYSAKAAEKKTNGEGVLRR